VPLLRNYVNQPPYVVAGVYGTR
nr:hypothetical protein CTI12_AA490680 [Tanacetum cinerariifolium]